MAVNLSALAGAGQQFFSDSGVPLAGGKLYSYAAGTTTPQTTYTSASGSTAHTNPIILNSAGRVATGEIWLTAGSNYKFALYTSADVLITTWDNITGINGTGITSNASNVTYDPAGTGAVATTVQTKLRESVSVKDFGVGVPALKLAVAQINAIGGGDLYLGLDETYNIDWGIENSVLLIFNNCVNTKIISNGAKFVASNSNGLIKVFIRIDNCQNFNFDSLDFTGSLAVLDNLNGGEAVLNIQNNSQNITWDILSVKNSYRAVGVNLMSGNIDALIPDPNPCSGIYGNSSYLHTVYYGFYFDVSGNNANINAVSLNSGRVYYNVNTSNHVININGQHGGAFSECLFSAKGVTTFSTSAIRNVELNYSSDGRYPGSGNQTTLEALVAFDWLYFNAPAEINDIRVHVNVNASATDKPANLSVFRKYYWDGAGYALDTIGGRNHLMKLIDFSGYARNWNNATECGLLWGSTAYNWSGDTINGINIHDLNISGAMPSTGILLAATSGIATTQTYTLNNIRVDGTIEETGNTVANISYEGVYGTNLNALNNATQNFTPKIRDGATGNIATASNSIGRITKTGNMVYVRIGFTNINTTGLTAGNTVFVTDLPFSVNTVSNLYSVVQAVFPQNIASAGGNIFGIFSGTTINMIKGTTTGSANLIVSDLTSGTANLWISGSYVIA
jgi:hypothetical protein